MWKFCGVILNSNPLSISISLRHSFEMSGMCRSAIGLSKPVRFEFAWLPSFLFFSKVFCVFWHKKEKKSGRKCKTTDFSDQKKAKRNGSLSRNQFKTGPFCWKSSRFSHPKKCCFLSTLSRFEFVSKRRKYLTAFLSHFL